MIDELLKYMMLWFCRTF